MWIFFGIFSRRGKPCGYTLANALVFKNVLKQLGLDRCHTLLSGAAPISPEVLEYLASIGINVVESFGMSESSGKVEIGYGTGYRYTV